MFSKTKSMAGTLLIGMLAGLMPVSAIAEDAKIFSDLSSKTTPYVEAIKYLRDNGVVQGYDDGTFKPSAGINRAEFVKILIGAYATETPTGNNCFPDVLEDWYAPYVCTAKKLGVIEGYPDGNFKPANPINFAEAAKIIANTFKLNHDGNDPEVWFKGYIEALQREKAIPMSVEYFDEEITRDEMSEIIWRIKADIKNKASKTYKELNGEGLVTVGSCSELKERMDSLSKSSKEGMYEKRNVSDEMVFQEAPAAKGLDNAKNTEGIKEFSTTNIQEAGVDEADIVKNDGRYIYMIKENSIRIVDAYPANTMKEITNFQLGSKNDGFYPNEMYINGDQLVVIGAAYKNNKEDDVVKKMNRLNGTKSRVYLVDISDRANPKVSRSIDFDGDYMNSRRVGDTLYMVINKYQYLPYIPYFEGIRENDNYTNDYDINDILPKMSDSKTGKVELVAPCEQIKIMPKPNSKNFLITVAIPLKDVNKGVSRDVIVGSGNNVYASKNNLYVTSSDLWGSYLKNKAEQTKIYKFELNKDKIDFRAEGVVPGTILDQFSMDEHRGNLRIATTQNINEDKKTKNNLYVLNNDLKTIGRIENIAPGEKFYSVRFMGDRAYLVTFKFVDPLFAVDISNPTAPKILGELKVPGYSEYLHPYDENHLIGFGKDVNPNIKENDDDSVSSTDIRGFKMGLFDVTNPQKPKELFSETIGDSGTYSVLLENHKALLFDKEKNLIAFPITETRLPESEVKCREFVYSTCPSSCKKVCKPSCKYENGVTICDDHCDGENSCQSSNFEYPKTVFEGAYVYGLDLKNGFKLKGKITNQTEDEKKKFEKEGYADWRSSIGRILYIGDVLYTVSQDSVKASDLTDSLKEIKHLKLKEMIQNLDFENMDFGQPIPIEK